MCREARSKWAESHKDTPYYQIGMVATFYTFLLHSGSFINKLGPRRWKYSSAYLIGYHNQQHHIGFLVAVYLLSPQEYTWSLAAVVSGGLDKRGSTKDVKDVQQETPVQLGPE